MGESGGSVAVVFESFWHCRVSSFASMPCRSCGAWLRGDITEPLNWQRWTSWAPPPSGAWEWCGEYYTLECGICIRVRAIRDAAVSLGLYEHRADANIVLAAALDRLNQLVRKDEIALETRNIEELDRISAFVVEHDEPQVAPGHSSARASP